MASSPTFRWPIARRPGWPSLTASGPVTSTSRRDPLVGARARNVLGRRVSSRHQDPNQVQKQDP
jgi:hypothetical protein